jgi:3'(2'), 5'-bisphosphate nucleotidase
MIQPSSTLTQLVSLALAAGGEIMRIYATDFATRAKTDKSPVTDADELAEKVILAGLDPAIPVLAEESAAAGKIPTLGNRFFLVDPLDGTKEFLSRNGEFTVNIALVEGKTPVAGVVYAPALDEIFVGERGKGALRATASKLNWSPIKTRPRPTDGLTVVASRSHRDADTDAFLQTQTVKELVSAGSSLKFCRVAEGKADLYPRFGRTMEWDTGAGQAVLEAAGGRVVTTDNQPLVYNKAERGFDNPAFIASGT